VSIGVTSDGPPAVCREDTSGYGRAIEKLFPLSYASRKANYLHWYGRD